MVGFGPADVPPSAAVKFVGAGTAACFADLLTFPLDTAKVRLQVSKLFAASYIQSYFPSTTSDTVCAHIQIHCM